MEQNLELTDENPYNSFRVDLLNLNLHLTQTETAPEAQRVVHEKALAQMRALVSHS
ncbi:MAG TPA: hypothetical protein VFQ91_15400 [Bryobacteraceae bacterium]|nr:hypothetical protein [Bryobacteraceae bacterium]